jgi:hypothetical protein
MVHSRTIRIAAGLLALMVTVGCQHNHRRECCPCSCATGAQPETLHAPQPSILKAVPAEPAVRMGVGEPLQ